MRVLSLAAGLLLATAAAAQELVLIPPATPWIGDEVLVEAIAEAHPTRCEWRWYAPGEPSGGPADAAGFTTTWIPDEPGVWTLHARVFYAHEWPAGQLYRTNARLDVLVVDPMPFADGFELGDTSAWSKTVS